MAHLVVVGVVGTTSASAVGIVAAVRTGSRQVVAAFRSNWPVALTLGLGGALLLGGLSGVVGDALDAGAIGAAAFTVGFVHGLDL